jgi:hypothetical protein
VAFFVDIPGSFHVGAGDLAELMTKG